jgi:hypothetical protein
LDFRRRALKDDEVRHAIDGKSKYQRNKEQGDASEAQGDREKDTGENTANEHNLGEIG